MLIRLGHSPDPDDAFMFWGLAKGEVDPRGFEFEHVLQDIQTLNEWALEGRLEVTAISLHAYPHVQDRYVLLPHGASMGSGYGPIVVAREELDEDDLRRVEIAVPGRMTTAFRTEKMAVAAPMPIVSVVSTAALKPRALTSERMLYRTSWRSVSMIEAFCGLTR